MKRCFLVLAFLLAACSKVTEDNYRKIEDGMTEEQVVTILGKPTESNSVSVLGVGGTVSR
jgi:outer membrane protein assembly factor BamE (lipoprotein component of BamABCDE complex)